MLDHSNTVRAKCCARGFWISGISLCWQQFWSSCCLCTTADQCSCSHTFGAIFCSAWNTHIHKSSWSSDCRSLQPSQQHATSCEGYLVQVCTKCAYLQVARIAAALALAPLLDNACHVAQQKLGLTSRRTALSLVVLSCIALASLCFGATVLVWA